MTSQPTPVYMYTVHVLLVPWLSGVYLICITSAVKCIPEGKARGNPFNCTSGTNPYIPESHGTGYMYPDTRTLPPSTSMPAHITSISEAGNNCAAISKLVEHTTATFSSGGREYHSDRTNFCGCQNIQLWSTTRTELAKAFQRLPSVRQTFLVLFCRGVFSFTLEQEGGRQGGCDFSALDDGAPH